MVKLEYIIGYFQDKTNDVFTFLDIIHLFSHLIINSKFHRKLGGLWIISYLF